MEDKYRFLLGYHGDIYLYPKTNKRNIDLGYHYNLKLPAMMWLFNVQVSKKNIFEKFENFEIYEEVRSDENLKDILKDFIEISELPYNKEMFNSEIDIRGISHFSNGHHNTYYQWTLNKDKNLDLHRSFRDNDEKDIALTLSINDSVDLMESYWDFLKSEDKLFVYREDTKRLINSLREI